MAYRLHCTAIQEGDMRFTAFFAVLAATMTWGPPVSAQSTPSAASPAETCLALFTFEVPAGDHPHDVAPTADGQHIWYTAQRSGALGSLDPVSGEVEKIPLGQGSAPHGVIVGPDGA